MARQRLEISICYTDKRDQKRYVNNLGSLWIDTDTMKGNIDLPPGVSISGGDHYVNVQQPREMPPRSEEGRGGGTRARTGGYNNKNASDDDNDIPF